MEAVQEVANPNVQIVRATRHLISRILAGEMGHTSRRDQQRWAVAMAAHALSAARRDGLAAKVLAGRFRNSKSFAVRASRVLFGQQSTTTGRLLALAIERMTKEQLDTKSTLALLTKLGLVNFGKSLDAHSSHNRGLNPIEVAKMTSFIGSFVQQYPQMSVAYPDFTQPATLVLVHKTEEGKAKAVVLTNDLERIYNAVKTVRRFTHAGPKV